MRIGLVGFPKTGKTTIFNALTASEHPTDKYIQVHDEANIGVVQVLDERITYLSEKYHPKKTIYATIEFYDFPGVFADSNEHHKNTDILSEIKLMDGLALVLRNFEDSELDELYGIINPIKALNKFEEELILTDMIVAEKRIEKIELGYKRGVKTAAIQNEERVLHQVIEHLHQNLPLRSLQLGHEEEKLLRGFQFLSQKPLLILLNCSESDFYNQGQIIDQFRSIGYQASAIAGRFEEELSRFDEEDAKSFMEDIGLTETVKNRLTHLCYELMGYLSFFTVGDDEVRAWTIQKGDNAVTAAGKIHSDLARGFIRAECFKFDDFKNLGSEKALREKGLIRLEGKEYIVADGDIISIRFNV